MKIEIKNKTIKKISDSIKGTSYENKVFIVGGFVRDLIMGKEPKDIDLLVDGNINAGIEFAEWFCKKNKIYKKDSNPLVYGLYGTAMFQFNGEKIESVAPRSEKYKNDSRNPIVSSCTLEDDCLRRDFTINSLFINISNNELIDYSSNGLNDIKNTIIRSTSNPDIIFNDDSLRILRMIRFASKLGFKIEENTLNGAKKNVNRLEIISKERIQDEFSKMMTSGHADIAMKLINEIGAWKYIFNGNTCGEIEMALANLKKITDADYHNLEVNLAIVYAYLADVENRMKYLKFSNDVIDKVMFYLDLVDEINFLHFKPSNLRKLQYFAKSFDNLFNACTIFLSIFPNDEKKVMKIINDSKYMIKDGCAMFGYRLPVDGNDVMAIKNIGPSAKVKEYLELLMEQAYVNPHITKKNCEKILNCN